jgi:tripartite-type tricarboxylate transporter receptor subunit TctC
MKTRMMQRRLIAVSVAISACFGAAVAIPAAWAADYPDRSITMVIPYAAGGSTDALGRVLARSMGNALKQQVTVENVGGAGGTMGTARVAKAKADGYTMLFHNMGHAAAPSLYRNLPYDPVDSFEPIGSVADVPMILVARKDFPAKNFGEVLNYMRANPDKVVMANAGVGSTTHLCEALLKNATKARLTSISYKGTGPALNDLIGGHVDLLCDQPASTTGHITKGMIKPIAVATRNRISTLPDVPTFEESGLKDFELSVWHGLYVPHGTPKPVVDKLAAALRTALKDPLLTERFASLGAQIVSDKMASPDGLRSHVKSEIAKLGEAIRAAGVAPE